MGFLTLLGYTPLTPHQEARANLWRDTLQRASAHLAFMKDERRDFDRECFRITHRRRRQDFATGEVPPTDDDAARFFAKLDGDPEMWIAETQRQRSEAQDEAMRPIREHIARRKAMKTSLEQWEALSPIEFEHACAQLLRRSGYADVRVTSASADGGVDIIATKDGRGFAVQCKRYQHTVGPEPVRALAGVVASHPKQFSGGGIFMTTNWFSTAAWREGRQAKLTLITGEHLVAMAQAAAAPAAAAGTTEGGAA